MAPTAPTAASFACDALHAAAPLAKLLHEVAVEWSHSRKGRPIAAHEAYRMLCDEPASPCALFSSTRALVHRLSQHVRGRAHVVAIGDSASHHVAWLASRGWRATVLRPSTGGVAAAAAPSNVSVVPLDESSLAAAREATLLLMLDGGAAAWWPRAIAAIRPWVALMNETAGAAGAAASSSSAFGTAGAAGAAAGSAFEAAGYESYRAPYFLGGSEHAEHTAAGSAGASVRARSSRRAPRRSAATHYGRRLRSSSRGGRRRGSRAKHAAPAAAAVAGLTTLWRLGDDGACATPLWDLSRPMRLALRSEAAAAAAAVRAGVPLSEWFACATVEALRPLARTLFTLPRRAGKSVWHTCMRERSPCFWFTGAHHEGEHFVTQVLSSPDVLLSRLSAFRAAAIAAASPADAATLAARPLLLVDPAAGEGNYTQHLPDGMGAMPALRLVASHGWHALLAEPAPSTFKWLARNFAPHVKAGSVALRMQGLTAGASAVSATLHTLAGRVPELEGVYEDGLPPVTRQRLQWASSVEIATTRSVRGDLWLFNHLAGGPVLEALEVAGLTPQAKAFSRCKGNSAKLKRRCYNATIVPVEVPLKPWGELLSSHTPSLKQIDLLVVDLRDPTVGSLLRSFPLSEHKPTFIYYRNGDRGVRKHLLRHGYQTSAHWETSAWGEHTLAWRADRCLHGRLFTP